MLYILDIDWRWRCCRVLGSGGRLGFRNFNTVRQQTKRINVASTIIRNKTVKGLAGRI